MIAVQAAGISDIGCKRTHNQDRIFMQDSSGVFVLADGMGGERCGELAAEIAVNVVTDYLAQRVPIDLEGWPFDYDSTLSLMQNRLMNGVRLANRRVWETSQSRRDCDGMGTTVSILVCGPDIATIGNIGDSRVYIFRDMRLRLLTHDDAVVANLLEAGEISPEEARIHPLRNVLTRALGKAEDVAVQLIEFSLRPEDRLLLCSDGLHGVLDDSEIRNIIASDTNPRVTVKDLVEAAKHRGGPDNISCILVLCT